MQTLAFARIFERLILVGCAPLLLYIGYRLFVLGVTGQIQLAADVKDSVRAKVTNLSPGALCFVLAVAIAICSYLSPLSLERSRDKQDASEEKSDKLQADATSGSENRGAAPSPADHDVKERNTEKAVYEGGPPQGIKANYILSQDLRRSLSDVLLCQMSQPPKGPDSCYDTTGYNRKFRRIPLPVDLAKMERVESRPDNATEADARMYADLKRMFLAR